MGLLLSTRRALIGGKGEGWWSVDGIVPWAAYQPKGASSIAGSYTDLSGSGNDAGVGTAPTWNATDGWIFLDVSNQYLTTTFTPQNDQTQSMIVRYSDKTSAAMVLAGSRSAANRQFEIGSWSVGNLVYYHNGQNVSVAPDLTAGNLCIAGNQGYRNGVAEGAAIGAWLGASSWPVWIGAQNNAGVLAGACSVYIQAIALYNSTLAATQVATIYAAMSLL